ncbi:MAG: SH3 domain-containing protein, partial [Chloroflexota bacterium]|nr:SH3 domain-containing protein [Chloroflexota bacterium]
MTTTSYGPSLSTRLRTFALAGAIALGGMAPAALAARADGTTQGETRVEAEPPADSAGAFNVTVDSIAELTGLTAVVAGDGERVNVRDEPAHTGEVVTQLDDGTTVDLRIDRLDTVYGPDGVRWWPVSADGIEGWVSGFYLAETKIAVDAPAQFTLDGPGLIGRTAVINGGGDGINLRATPGHDGDVRDVLADGTVVDLRIDREDTVYD